MIQMLQLCRKRAVLCRLPASAPRTSALAEALVAVRLCGVVAAAGGEALCLGVGVAAVHPVSGVDLAAHIRLKALPRAGGRSRARGVSGCARMAWPKCAWPAAAAEHARAAKR